ncbi:asparaginase [Salibacterium aidingense]|uniref:asparaginase n=1 Tax=Salibacterium aidingense TaxID=384933 RepID=UPI003BE08E30
MKKILVLHTGGTIAMQENEETGGVTTGDSNPVQQWNTLVSEDYDIVSDDFLQLPSPHITPSHMLKLFHHMNERLQDTKAEGVVITHGTDTLEETAYLLDLLHTMELPVVLTGAMRSSDEVGSDGPHNFITAVRTAASEKAKGMGVLIVMNDEIHTAKNATKTHASNVATFQSPQYGPIGLITKREIFFHHQPLQREHFHAEKMDKKVLLIKTYAGLEGDVFQHLISQPLDGVVIEALGQGNVPPALMEPVQSLIDHRIPVVLVTRCFSGVVQDIYSYQGGGRTLKEAGVIFTNGLNGPKARLKLMAALENHLSRETLRKCFERF